MIDKRAEADDVLRVIIPNTHVLQVLPPGSLLEVTGYLADQSHTCFMRVVEVPPQPTVYNVVVPKGATVQVHEE